MIDMLSSPVILLGVLNGTLAMLTTFDIRKLRTAQHGRGWCDAKLAKMAEVGVATVWGVMNGKGKCGPFAPNTRGPPPGRG